jgi:putative glutamine amidotransferase
MNSAAKPLIGIPANAKRIKPSADQRFEAHWVQEQYIRAVIDGAGGVPVLLPALGDETADSPLIERLDGLLFTGGRSNVEPHRYNGPAPRPETLNDPRRDATTLPLIRRAVDEGIPLLAICRGHQELNVALGGTLHQHVHEVPGKNDHRAPRGEATELRYAHSHTVRLTPGGLLARLAGAEQAKVNSLHGQAIDKLAPSLVVEAVAPDEIVEGVRVPDAPAFALGVQWHPEWFIAEWGVADDPFARAIFAAFGDAARERAQHRT